MTCWTILIGHCGCRSNRVDVATGLEQKTPARSVAPNTTSPDLGPGSGRSRGNVPARVFMTGIEDGAAQARSKEPIVEENRRKDLVCPGVRVGIVSALVLVSVTASQPLHAQQDAGLPAGEDLPTPESVLGQRVGADFFLATWEQSLEYLRALDAASDRIELREVGESSLGRPVYLALISSAANLADIDRHRDIALRLAHPKGLTEPEARELADEGRAIVWIDGGLHASEVAHGQHTIQLAYDLVAGRDPITGSGSAEIAAILDNVILMLWPSINPDGQTMVADWYRKNLGTPYEVAPMPFLYQKYIGHDNNRDGYMVNQIESRYTTRVAREWEPQILYNHHQSSPFPTRIWIPPFAEPISPHVHPLMWRTVNLMGMAMAQALEERGQTGATHMGTGFDNWYPGFMDHAHNFHNVASFLTETALYRYATPGFYTISDFPGDTRELRPRSLYSSPWKGGWWRLRDAVDYMLTASVSVLDFAAKYRTDVLYNRYQAGRDIIEQYRTAPPYAYFIHQDQRDPVAAVELLRRLAFNGIEVGQLASEVEHDGIRHSAGTWVIMMDQEFANFVRQLFEIQQYPDLREYPEGPPDQPYDVAGWTLPLQMGVSLVAAQSPLPTQVRDAVQELGRPVATDPAEQEGRSRRNVSAAEGAAFDSPRGIGFDSHPVASAIVPPPGEVSGSGPALHLDPGQNNTFKALNRAWSAGAGVGYDAQAQAYAVTGLSWAAEQAMVDSLALRATRGPAGIRLTRPRIGLYRPWRASMDEGWTRWLLERYDFEFASLRNADVLAGGLRGRYDVIIIPDMSAGTIREGYATGSVPPRYAGGLGDAGVRELKVFVEEGGTLVAINNGARFAVGAFHLRVRDVTQGLSRLEYFQSGSIVSMETDPSHPVMAGVGPRHVPAGTSAAAIVVEGSPAFELLDGFEGRVMARFDSDGSPLLSGYLLGEEHIQGYASAVDVRKGKGRVLLLGMRPQWRGQPFGNFPILFGAALFTEQLAGTVPQTSDFTATSGGDATDAETGTPRPRF